MCRLFGFRSVIPSQVHRSCWRLKTRSAFKATCTDGWGVAFYIDGAPHVTRSPSTALGDALFHRLSGVVASETVLAHVAQSDAGDKTVFNCHPFQHGRWCSRTNGDIPRFEELRGALLELVDQRLRRFVMGDPMKWLFFVFLSELGRAAGAGNARSCRTQCRATQHRQASARAVRRPPWRDAALLTLMATDGENPGRHARR